MSALSVFLLDCCPIIMLSFLCLHVLKPLVSEAFCSRLCLYLNESVHPENVMNTTSQKSIKGISLNYGHTHRCTWVHSCAD